MGWRTLIGLPFAGAVVMFLFLFMAGAIRNDVLPEPGKVLPRVTMPFVPDDTPPEPVREVEREAPTPPPPTTFTETPLDPVTITDPGPARPEPPEPTGTLPVLDREPTPIVAVSPTGFERCIDDDGATHRVRLLFDITPSGETTNIEIIDSTDSCYEASARRALRQWRYNPRIVNGEPVWQYGRQATIVFETS